MKDGLYTFEELSFYMDKAEKPAMELLKASQDREKLLLDDLIKIEHQFKEMQKTLEWYANPFNYAEVIETNDPDLFQGRQVLHDEGKRARKCLEGAINEPSN